MFTPLIDHFDLLTDEQKKEQVDVECAVAALCGIDATQARKGSFEVMSLADDKVRVHWVGMTTVSREALLALVPGAKIV